MSVSLLQIARYCLIRTCFRQQLLYFTLSEHKVHLHSLDSDELVDHIRMSYVWFYSNSYMWAQTLALPRFLCTAAVCTERPVLNAAWPETPTAPGMERPALATCQTQRGLLFRLPGTAMSSLKNERQIGNK